jgi:hypothetical protein
MDTSNFAKRVASRETGRADEYQAAKEDAERRMALTNQARTQGLADFRRFDGIAATLVNDANAALGSERFIKYTTGGNGVGVRCGTVEAWFTQSVSAFVGESTAKVTVRIATPTGATLSEATYDPVIDPKTQSFRWVIASTRQSQTAEELVERSLDELHRRASP